MDKNDQFDPNPIIPATRIFPHEHESKELAPDSNEDQVAKSIELPTSYDEALKEILSISDTLIIATPEQSRELAKALTRTAAEKELPCCLIDLQRLDDFDRLSVDISVVGGEIGIEPGILPRTLTSQQGILLIYNALENSEGINDIFDRTFWQLNATTQFKIAEGLTIIGIAPIESPQALKNLKISPAQFARYQQTCKLPAYFDFEQPKTHVPQPPAEISQEITIDCGFMNVDALETHLLGTYPRDKTGERQFVPGILTKALEEKPERIIFTNVLLSNISVELFLEGLRFKPSFDQISIEISLENIERTVRKKIISIKLEDCKKLTHIIWISGHTINSLPRSILKIQSPKDKSYFLYEEPTGLIDQAQDNPFYWVINSDLLPQEFYSLITETRLPELYLLDGVSIPTEIEPWVEKQSSEIKSATDIPLVWVKVVIEDDKNRQAVLNQLIKENKQSTIIHIAEHDTRLIDLLYQVLQKKQCVILTDLAKNRELLESLHNFFNSAAGYRDLNGDWLQPATTGGSVILLISPEEFKQHSWLQILPQQDFTLAPEPLSAPVAHFESLFSALENKKHFIHCKGANTWQLSNTIDRLQNEMKATVWQYRLGPSTNFANFEAGFMQWAEDQKKTTPQIFVFTGEMSSPALLFLQGLLRPAAMILPNSQTVSLSENHVVIFFEDAQAQEPLPLLSDLTTVIVYKRLTFNEIEKQILLPFMHSEKLDTVDRMQTYSLPMLLRQLNGWMERWGVDLSIEDYLAIIGRIAAHDFPLKKKIKQINKSTPLLEKWRAAINLVVLTQLKSDMKSALICWLDMLMGHRDDQLYYYEEITEQLLAEDKSIIVNSQTGKALDNIFQYLQSYLYFSQKKQKMPGKNALGVTGETMAGKSFLVTKALEFVLGKTGDGFLLVNGGPYAQIPAETKKIVVYSELNLLALELLNQLGNTPLIGTMNPPGERYESRQKLPPSLAASMFQFNLETLPTAELLKAYRIPSEHHSYLLDFHADAGSYANTRSLMNAARLCQRQDYDQLVACTRAYAYSLWDADKLNQSSPLLVSTSAAGFGKMFFYFFQGIDENELFIKFSTQDDPDLWTIQKKEIIFLTPKPDAKPEDYCLLMLTQLSFSIQHWISSVIYPKFKHPLESQISYLMTFGVLQKYYSYTYELFSALHYKSLNKIIYKRILDKSIITYDHFEEKAMEWIKTSGETKDFNDRDTKIVLFMYLFKFLQTDKDINWPKIARLLQIKDHALFMKLLDMYDLKSSEKASIKNFIEIKKVSLIKKVLTHFNMTEIKEVGTPKPLIGSSELSNPVSGLFTPSSSYKLIAQISPPQVYYFPTHHFALNDMGLPQMRGHNFLTNPGLPDIYCLSDQKDKENPHQDSPSNLITIHLKYSELDDNEEMLLLMPIFCRLYSLPNHLDYRVRNGNYYVRKKVTESKNPPPSGLFSYQVLPCSAPIDFKSEPTVHFTQEFSIDETKLPPPAPPLLHKLKTADSQETQRPLNELTDWLRSFKYIEDDDREAQFNLQAAYLADAEQVDLLKIFYFCLAIRKVLCIHSAINFLILVHSVLINKVNADILSGFMSDDSGKLTDEGHAWPMVNGVIFEPTPELTPQATTPEIKSEVKESSPETKFTPKPESASEIIKPKKTSDEKLETKKILSTSKLSLIACDQKKAPQKIKVDERLIKNRDLILPQLEPLFKILGGQASRAGGFMHTHFPVSQNINHRREAAGLPAYLKRGFPISFVPKTLISVNFPIYDKQYLPVKDFSRHHFFLQCLLDKGFKLAVPTKEGIIECKNVDDFISNALELNPTNEIDISRFKHSNRLSCRIMHIDDWNKVFNQYFTIVEKIPNEKKSDSIVSFKQPVKILSDKEYLKFKISERIPTDEKEMIEMLTTAANKKHTFALLDLGLRYHKGIGMEKSLEKALHFLKLARQNGSFHADNYLYSDEAIELCRLEANEGGAKAQDELGFRYLKGIDVPKDENEAVRLFKLAADQGNRHAVKNLARCYQNGIGGLEKDLKEALRLNMLIRENDYFYLYNNEGIPLLILAVNEYGHAEDQYELGSRYLKGDGVQKDEKEATRLLKLAADQGNRRAVHDLARCYEKGIGVEENQEESCRLLSMLC